MARILIESDDELPEIGEVLRSKASRSRASRTTSSTDLPGRPKVQSASAKDESAAAKSKQRPLKKLDASQSLFGPFDAASAFEPSKSELRRREIRSSPRKGKPVKQIKIFEDEPLEVAPSEKRVDAIKPLEELLPEDDEHSSSEDSYHISEERASEDESWLVPKKTIESPFKRLLKSRPKSKLDIDEPAMDLSPKKGTDPSNPFLGPRIAPPTTSSRPTSSSSALDNAAILHYTPPKRISPSKKKQPFSRSATPPPHPDLPPSPSKKLNSPTKSRFAAIERTKIRESLDAFWSQDVVNDWNEQYSPCKIVASPRKNRFTTPPASDDENGGPPSPSTSPRKSRSPQKNASPVKSKEAREMKKAWDVRKKTMAQEFLNELDRKILDGKLAEMTKDMGGVSIVWNKKLNSTAGRANWRRERIGKQGSGEDTKVLYKHSASIELAEKVIDDETKLINVVAHEFCHLCNFMISGVKDNPHGKDFKEW